MKRSALCRRKSLSHKTESALKKVLTTEWTQFFDHLSLKKLSPITFMTEDVSILDVKPNSSNGGSCSKWRW